LLIEVDIPAGLPIGVGRYYRSVLAWMTVVLTTACSIRRDLDLSNMQYVQWIILVAQLPEPGFIAG